MEWLWKRASGRWPAFLARRIWRMFKACPSTTTLGRSYLSETDKLTELQDTLRVSLRCFRHFSRSHLRVQAISWMPIHKCLILTGCRLSILESSVMVPQMSTINLGMRENWSQQRTMTRLNSKWGLGSTVATRLTPLCPPPTWTPTELTALQWLLRSHSSKLPKPSSRTTLCTTRSLLKMSRTIGDTTRQSEIPRMTSATLLPKRSCPLRTLTTTTIR